MTRRLPSWAALTIAAACVALASSGCGAGDSTATSPTSGASGASARGPLTLDQCTGEKKDRKVTYETVPQKVFTLDPQSAEFLIALGLRDRIVGTWGTYSDEEMASLGGYAQQLKGIKAYDDKKTWPPPIETIASTRPDLVVTTYRLNIPGYLDATRLKKDAAIDSYSFTSYCTGETMRTFDPLFADITNLGNLFGVPDRAKTLISSMRADLDKAAKLTAGTPRVRVWEYAGEKTPYPVGGTGIPNAVMYLAGAQNVFEDVREVYAEVSWEQVAQRNPDVVWLQTSAGPGFIEAEDALRKATDSNPGLASVRGVAEKRYAVVPYTTAGTLSVHNAEAVLQLANALKKATSSAPATTG